MGVAWFLSNITSVKLAACPLLMPQVRDVRLIVAIRLSQWLQIYNAGEAQRFVAIVPPDCRLRVPGKV
jgi:hypothetical protein